MKRRLLNTADLEKHKIVHVSPGHAPSMVVTIGPAGNINVGTFEQTMVVSYQPPRILLAISPDSDTYKNIIDGSDAVVGFPRPEYVQQVYDGGVKTPRDISELDVVRGLSTYSSQQIAPPSIEQCWINMECRLKSDTDAGDHHLVILDIVTVSLDNEVLNENRIDRRNNLPAVYYTTSGNFFVPGEFQHVTLTEGLEKFKRAD